MTEPFLTLLDHTVQWIFNKTLLYEPSAATHSPTLENDSPARASKNDGGQYLQLVVSASYDLVNRSRQEITDLALREVRDVLPAAREANLVKSTVIKEIAATFSPEPGSDQWRPGPRCGIENMFLAGDWTRDGLARHDGRGRTQRLSGSRSSARGRRHSAKISAAGFAGRRIQRPLGAQRKRPRMTAIFFNVAVGFSPAS